MGSMLLPLGVWWKMKDEAGPVVEVSVFSFLQCFDITGWVTQKGTEPVKKTCATYPQRFSSGTSAGRHRWRTG